MGPGPWKWTQINQGQLGGSFGVHLKINQKEKIKLKLWPGLPADSVKPIFIYLTDIFV